MPFSLEPIRTLSTDVKIIDVDLSRDGSTLAVGAKNRIQVFDVDNGKSKISWTLDDSLSALSVSADGRQIAVADRGPEIKLFETAKGQLIKILARRDAPDFLRSDRQLHLSLYPDGKTLVSTGSKRRLYVSDIASEQWNYIMFIKFSPPCDCDVAATGEHVVLFGSPNASEISGHVTMYRVNLGLQPLWTRWHAGEQQITSASFSPDGKILATCNPNDGVRVWQVSTGDSIAYLGREVASNEGEYATQKGGGQKHTRVHPNTKMDPNEIVGAAMVDSNTVLIATNKTLNLWDVETHQFLNSVSVDESITSIKTSSNGRTLSTVSTGNRIGIWKTVESTNKESE